MSRKFLRYHDSLIFSCFALCTEKMTGHERLRNNRTHFLDESQIKEKNFGRVRDDTTF